MLTEVNVSFKLESLRSIPESEIAARIHDLLLDLESESENFFGESTSAYALLMPDIEVETEQV